MIYQRYTRAILDGYRDDPDVADHLVRARANRAWLETLHIETGIKQALVEQARVVEEAFERLVRA